MRKMSQIWLPILLVCLSSLAANAQNPPVEQGGGSFRPQCPTATVRHPGMTNTGGAPAANPTPQSSEAPYTGPVSRYAKFSPVTNPVTGQPYTFTDNAGQGLQLIDHGGAIKCQQVSGGDGYMTEADGNQTFMFAFGPLSGMRDIENGLPTGATQFAETFDKPYCDPARPTYNSGQPNPNYQGGCIGGTDPNGAVGYVSPSITDSAAIMNTGVMNGSIPGPLSVFDEDDEFFLTLTNVGMIMRPDLFEQHTIHYHGYPNASSFYDGVPDASIAINIGGSFTYYYLAPDAGTYFWHCHITPPEHLQMGMVAQLYVRPRQNRLLDNTDPYISSTVYEEADLRTACRDTGAAYITGTLPPDILCSAPQPASDVHFVHHTGYKYVYNDGDGSTRYDKDYPLQIHGFDPNFHFVGMTFNPEGFSDMKDKYFLLNGRSYPDTVGVAGGSADVLGQLASAANPEPVAHAITTAGSDGQNRPTQPLPSLITLKNNGGPNGTGERAALRIADLDVQEYQTLSSIGIPMLVVGFNAKILRDQAGNNLFIKTNSITLGGGESLDVILDSTGVPAGTYFLYTPQLDHLSNDAENFGGLMTEVCVYTTSPTECK